MGRQISRKQAEAKEAMMSKLHGLPLLGSIITWNAGSGDHSFRDVRDALKTSSLDDKIARELLPRYAFSRACKQMEEDRLIDLVKEESDTITFQFTKKAMDRHAEEWTFRKETKLVLNKITGKIKCQLPEVESMAQKLIDQATERRTTSDITKIVQKLFEAEADMFPIRDQGGAYFVPQMYVDFVAKIKSFLHKLGGEVSEFPIIAGTSSGDKSVQDVLTSNLNQMIEEHKSAVDAFGRESHQSVLNRQAEHISSTRVKIEAYAHLLKEKAAALLETLDDVRGDLQKKVRSIAKAQAENPELVTNGHSRPGINDFILDKLKSASKTEPLTLEKLVKLLIKEFPGRPEKGLAHTAYVQLCSSGWGLAAKGHKVLGSRQSGFWMGG